MRVGTAAESKEAGESESPGVDVDGQLPRTDNIQCHQYPPPPPGYPSSPWGLPGNPQQWGPPGNAQQWGPPGNAQQWGPPGNAQQWGPPGNAQQWGPYGAPFHPYHPAARTILIVHQPSVEPPDHMLLSILSCLCCCWLPAIAAICFSCKAKAANARYDYNSAADYSKKAKLFIIISVVTGIIFNIVVITLSVLNQKGKV